MILIDNYDSFTYNIVQYLCELGAEPRVFKNDKITTDDLRKMDFEHIIISPGAGTPDNAGVSLDVIKEFYKTKKVLGVCLGHQCIAQFFGAKIVKDICPCHGKVSSISHSTSKLFTGIPQNFEVTRYHSLVVEDVPSELKITAKTADGIVMALEHEKYALYGVQFHPEAVLTQYGHELLENFLKI